ncbi:hypothetical protein BLNAU_3132 [Blattamonas nauphoetae]|uniref:Uncharacterized protein n=1 Tax=Blattamonas nauphoetae TaxID=2049346 RepID=A0ABQ9YDA1_9EUKA|nr:hypothetical protein BLNAU_3132 [Blattamonas nauphoetae]
MLNAENVEIQDLVNQKAEDTETNQTAEPPQDASDANDSQTPKRLDSEHSSKDTSTEPESGPAPQHLSRLHSASFSSGIWDAHDPPACERGFAWLVFKPVLAVCIVGEFAVVVAEFGSEGRTRSAVEGAEGKNGVSGEAASDLCRESAMDGRKQEANTIRTAEDASISFILLVAFVKDGPNLDGKATQQAS